MISSCFGRSYPNPTCGSIFLKRRVKYFFDTKYKGVSKTILIVRKRLSVSEEAEIFLTSFMNDPLLVGAVVAAAAAEGVAAAVEAVASAAVVVVAAVALLEVGMWHRGKLTPCSSYPGCQMTCHCQLHSWH